MSETVSRAEIETTRCGYVALIGRPNVGKSTLLNCLLGQKISITSRRPQTTRHRILGIKTLPGAQAIYVDTPGFHDKGTRLLNRYLNRTAESAIEDVDLVLFVTEACRFTAEDKWILHRLGKREVPTVLVLNKTDRVADKQRLLPYIADLARKMKFAAIIPLSARRRENVAALEQKVFELLPAGPIVYPEDQFTDRSERFLVAEIIREKLTRHLGQELPYALTVVVDWLEEQTNLCRIAATIFVERPGQKAIVIGKGGKSLKSIGQEARLEMERLLGIKVFLELCVKVRMGWSDNERLLRSFGYSDN